MNLSFLQNFPCLAGRRNTALSVVAVGLALVGPGCGGVPAGQEPTAEARSADLPADPNWTHDIVFDSIVAGVDSDGTPLYPCRAIDPDGFFRVGVTRPDFGSCHLVDVATSAQVPSYQTLTAHWTDASGGTIPTGALTFGEEAPTPGQLPGPALYPCRADLGGGLQVGKIEPGFGGCFIPYGGHEVSVTSYQVLTSSALPLPLADVPGAPFPFDAIVGGFEADGTPLYVCHARFQGGVHPGKTHRDWGSCDISWSGGEHWVTDSFTVLVPSFLDTLPRTPPGTQMPLPVGSFAFAAAVQGFGYGICRMPVGSSLQVGSVVLDMGDSRGCSLPDGNELLAPAFQVLARPPPPST